MVPCMVVPAMRPLYRHAAGGEGDLLATHVSEQDRYRFAQPAVSVPDRSWNVCFSVSSPCGRRHVPSTLAGTIQRCAVHHVLQSGILDRVVRRPVVHLERIRDHARSRLHVEDLRPQLQHHVREQKHRENRGLGKIALEQIGLDEASPCR